MTQNRKVVLSLEPLDSDLEGVLSSAGFPTRKIRVSKLDQSAPEARALVLRFRDLTRFLSQFRSIRDLALKHGVLIMVILDAGKPAEHAHAWRAIQLDLLKTHPAKPIQIRFPNPAAVALDIATYEIGPGFSTSVVIEPMNISADHRFLLARAFSKYVRIRAKLLDGGASGAGVYQVTAFRTAAEQHPIPFLAKIDEAADANYEQENFRRYVRDYIPFNLRPNVIVPRACYTATQGIIVEDFVERAVRFDQALSTSAPAQLITSLFQGTLRGWRLIGANSTFSARDSLRPTNSSGEEVGLVRNNVEFGESCVAAAKRFKRTYNPAKILGRLDALPAQETHHCTIHGDLHARNVFVAAGSTDCLIIDYANAKFGPACMDPACLEVDLVLSSKRPPPGRFLKSAYAWPLQPLKSAVRQQCDTWLWEAVRSLRVEAEIATNGRAYVMALIGYLLRLARLRPVKLRKRAVAVCIAEWLLCQLENGKTKKTTSSKKIQQLSSGSKRPRSPRKGRSIR
jgi:hypothetical protein